MKEPVLRKSRNNLAFQLKNRAAANLNAVVPDRGERLDHADTALYDMVPEQARVQPLADADIYRIKPDRQREK